MKVALASLFVLMAIPALAGPSLKCSINGKDLEGVLHEDGTAQVSAAVAGVIMNVKAVRSGGYKGASVEDTVTIEVENASGQLEKITAQSAVSLETQAASLHCAVNNL